MTNKDQFIGTFCLFKCLGFFVNMTYLIAKHTSLWISDPIWSTGAISSCHNNRPARRTLSLFWSDCGLENLNTTLRGQNKTSYIKGWVTPGNCTPLTDLEHYQDAADDAGISINHGLFHDVTDAAKMPGFDGMLFPQQGSQWQTIAASCQQVELMDAHSTNMMKQLVDDLSGGHCYLYERTHFSNV